MDNAPSLFLAALGASIYTFAWGRFLAGVLLWPVSALLHHMVTVMEFAGF
ncbi:MAG: hypothetical protein M0P74_13705 [Syntrophales bacterium]|nr:hypothetical protein [Syntrophales bacterium]